MWFTKIIVDIGVCFGLVAYLLVDNSMLYCTSRFVFYLVLIVTCLAVLNSLLLLGLPVEKRSKSLTKNFIQKQQCKSILFKIYEPLSDLAISLCLSIIGHPILAAVYFMNGIIQRHCEYEMVEYYDKLDAEKNN